MPEHRCLLIEVLTQPELAPNISLSGWDRIIRQGRQAELLAHLCILLDEHGVLSRVPVRPRHHLVSARKFAAKQARAMRWEVNRIQQAFSKTGTPVILLKGAAYVMADLPIARGRLFADIDILVSKELLTTAERSLLTHGWVSTATNAYDQRYYRQWMHELPPMRHRKRQTVIDVHHTILPETARLRPNPQKLLDAAHSLDENSGLQVLAPTDMVLHSATHLFHEGEFQHGLRDIVDLDGLLRHFSCEEEFWPRLVDRARELDLLRPLFYGLRYTRQLLGTPIPETALKLADEGRPTGVMLPLMDTLFSRGLVPHHASCDDRFSGMARWLLYIRSHYLRMPFYLLIPHLIRKAFRETD